jgi:predicted branched-subunit amino acid permease
MEHDSDIRAGFHAGLPLVLPTLALGISFGVLAEPIMGKVAPIVMSLVVFSGGAQFAALSVLLSGGAAGAAIGAGMLMNARWLPMSFAVTPSLLGGKTRRAAEAQAIVDASFVLASRGDGSFDRGKLIGATITQGFGWWFGTAIGVFAGGLLGEPEKLGLDAIFPAFYLALLVGELRHHDRDAWVVVALASAVTLALLPVAPPGIPVIAASAAALIGLRGA